MCGIVGKVDVAAPVPRDVIDAMSRRQRHRGPDSFGCYLADGVGLGIQRLRVIDLQTGDQPLYNEDRSIVVVLNGEIYNYQQLRTELSARGHSFISKGDTEVIVHLYEEYGDRFVERLDGMFALAIWDQPKRRLVLARDRVGKKPLHYFEIETGLSFASELSALMADASVPRAVDPSSVDSYLAFGYVPAPHSIWEGVRKLPPAHLLTWHDGQSELQRYWRLQYSPKRQESLDNLKVATREKVSSAVSRRMVADVPIGAFLSGGVDSSIVTLEMAQASSRPIKTFSIGFQQPAYDELPRARRVADLLGTEHHEFTVEPDATDVLPRLVAHYGEPFADSSAIPSYYLAELTREHVTVALNGDGGDESFAGYRRHVAAALSHPVDRLPLPVRRQAARVGSQIRDDHADGIWRSYSRRFLEAMPLSAAKRYEDHVSVFGGSARRSLYDEEFRRVVDPRRAAGVVSDPWRLASGESALDVAMSVDVETYLPGDLLVKMDIASMAHSLEARSPLLDHHLMEFAATVPPRRKAPWLRKKWLLREAYRGLLPDSVLDGKKMGFAVPLPDWCRGKLGEFAQEVLLDPATFDRGIFDRREVESVLAAGRAGSRSGAARTWALLFLESWFRHVGE